MPIFHDQEGAPMEPGSPSMVNRAELIERIKRKKSPSWGHPSLASTPDTYLDPASAGLEIERPRSALHAGDFREKRQHVPFQETTSSSDVSELAIALVHHWRQSSPAATIPSSRGASPFPVRNAGAHDYNSTLRSRAVSQSSYSSPFVFMPPTSPLVQQSNNTDLDFSSKPTSRQSSRSPDRSNRRYTFSPQSWQTLHSTQLGRSSVGTPSGPTSRREGTLPYQAHQPRRSVTSTHFQPHPTPQTPFISSRRPSFSSDAPPLHHAPMVGSYEESILRGRMSTTPSRPLDFVARIGVLGKGQCKPALRCPAHVTVPFPAVFYSYSEGNNRTADDSPSPYVGLIDLENTLSHPEEKTEPNRKRRQAASNPNNDPLDIVPGTEHGPPLSIEKPRRREKTKRRSTSPKAPPGGSYRIPQQGQLQIIIKNPNKTAVKLFLVPYDLSDMEPGHKTFIRQRSYSAGPIIDMPMSNRKNLGTDRPEAALSSSDDPNDRPILRYLVHLHMCCPAKGRYYLYKSIRVVFANRVPDDKETLRNEIQLPEPRYSTYKPSRESLAPRSSVTTSEAAETQTMADQAFRRRSLGVPLSQRAHEPSNGYGQRPQPPPPAVQFTGPTDRFSSPVSALGPMPFSLPQPSVDLRPCYTDTVDLRQFQKDGMDIVTGKPFTYDTYRTNTPSPGTYAGSPFHLGEAFEKLHRGNPGYGGNAFSGPAEGLLARKLRRLDVQYAGDEDIDS